MNKQTSTKNIVIGFALGVIVTASLGAALKHSDKIGRFQLEKGDGLQAYVIDTATGQIWSNFRHEKGRLGSTEKSREEFFLPKATQSKI